MLKVVFVLGCLLCLTLANPMDEVLERHVRSRHSGHHGCDSNSKEHQHHGFPSSFPPNLLQALLAFLQQQAAVRPTTTTAASTTTTAAPTTTTAAPTTTTAAPTTTTAAPTTTTAAPTTTTAAPTTTTATTKAATT